MVQIGFSVLEYGAKGTPRASPNGLSHTRVLLPKIVSKSMFNFSILLGRSKCYIYIRAVLCNIYFSKK